MLIGKVKDFEWVPASHGNVPEKAVSSGTDCGEAIFVGRALFESSMTVGKIHPSHGCIYIPYNGLEIRLPDYEVLIYTKEPSRREKRKEKKNKRKGSTSSSNDSDGPAFTPYSTWKKIFIADNEINPWIFDTNDARIKWVYVITQYLKIIYAFYLRELKLNYNHGAKFK